MTGLENLQHAWAAIDQKLDRNWKLNLEIIRRSNLDRVRNKLSQLIWVKGLLLALCLVFAVLFVIFTINNWQIVHMAITGIVLSVWMLAASIATIHELQLISSLDYSKPIPDMQRRLGKIRLVIIRYLRVGIWISPLYFSFIILFFKVAWNVDIVAVGDQAWIISNLILSIGVFLPLTIWAHFKLSTKNAEKNWMNVLLRGNGSQVTAAIHLIREIEEFEEEEE